MQLGSKPNFNSGRRSTVSDEKYLYTVPNVRSLRRKLNLTQEQFAHTFHLSLGAIRDWEQGRNQPDHAARALLRVIELNPDLVQRALQ